MAILTGRDYELGSAMGPLPWSHSHSPQETHGVMAGDPVTLWLCEESRAGLGCGHVCARGLWCLLAHLHLSVLMDLSIFLSIQ